MSDEKRASLAELRAALGESAVYTVREAARLLPGRESKNRAWIERQGIVTEVDGRALVIWGDVLARMRERGGVTRRRRKTTERPAGPGMRRADLG